jgi:SNF2 family DNA or RNA helicase
VSPQGAQDIYEHIAPSVLRMSAKDYLEMPPLIVEDIEVELPPKARSMYDQFEKMLRLDFKNGRVSAANSGVAMMKCRQIANGGIYLEEGSERCQHIHDAKTEAVEELIEELEGQPALVAYEFLHDLERLKKKLGKNIPHIGGGVSGKRSGEIIDQWNRGELPVLFGQPQSMSHGLNMQEQGRAVIWHSMIYNLEDYEQFIQRVWRQGQKGTVFVYRIIAQNTVDEAVVAALARKDLTQNALFDALKDYWK